MRIRYILALGLLAAAIAPPAFAQELPKPDRKALHLCKDHPAWTAEECQDVADKKLWVGMPVEMVFVEKPKSCVKDRHPGKGTPANMLQFACFVQWSHVERDRALPFLVQLTVEDGRVSSIAYN